MMLLCAVASSARQSNTRIVLLGTGTPNADPDRSGPAVAVVVDDVPYVVDCGPGVVRRAAAAARNGVTALSVERLRRLFVTHLHSDHTTGLPDFIFTPAVLDRDAPLEIYGPPGTKRMGRPFPPRHAHRNAVILYGETRRETSGAANADASPRRAIEAAFCRHPDCAHLRRPAVRMSYGFRNPGNLCLLDRDRSLDANIQTGIRGGCR
jgi:ribonuclease BN (tRNA processing enzyme)